MIMNNSSGSEKEHSVSRTSFVSSEVSDYLHEYAKSLTPRPFQTMHPC